MTDLPEILKKEFYGTKAFNNPTNSFRRGVERAFDVLVKAGWHCSESCARLTLWEREFRKMGWHSKQICLNPRLSEVERVASENGWRNSEDMKKYILSNDAEWHKKWEKARQQLKKVFKEKTLLSRVWIDMNIDEVLK